MKSKHDITPLRRAVKWLRDQRIIKRDNDLVEIFGLSKSTISSYLNGKPGVDFVIEFEKHFNISLKEFEKGATPLPKRNQSDEIAVLNARITELTRALARLNEQVTKVPALDFYIELEKRTRAELDEREGET